VDLLPIDWVKAGEERFTRYFKKKGWDEWAVGDGGRVVVEIAAAYAVVKALMPVRILVSLWATPWFARLFVIPIAKVFGKLRHRKS